MNNLDLENQLIEKLSIVRDEFIANREELAVSIRKDVVAAQLRDILINNPDFYQLKVAIEDYANDLIKNSIKGDSNER